MPPQPLSPLRVRVLKRGAKNMYNADPRSDHPVGAHLVIPPASSRNHRPPGGVHPTCHLRLWIGRRSSYSCIARIHRKLFCPPRAFVLYAPPTPIPWSTRVRSAAHAGRVEGAIDVTWPRSFGTAGAVLALLMVAAWIPNRVAHGHAQLSPPRDLSRPSLLPPTETSAHAPSGLAATRDMFFALADAIAAAPEASGAERSVPEGIAGASFVRAYSYLDTAWRSRLPFAQFVGAWRDVQRLELLAAIPSGSPHGNPTAQQTFVEVRTLESIRDRPVVAYAYGTYTAVSTKRGYYLISGGLSPEPHLVTAPASPEAVATTAITAIDPGASVRSNAPKSGTSAHTSTVTVTAGAQHTFVVHLYQLVNGQWVVTQIQR